jgi:hypothetical protein
MPRPSHPLTEFATEIYLNDRSLTGKALVRLVNRSADSGLEEMSISTAERIIRRIKKSNAGLAEFDDNDWQPWSDTSDTTDFSLYLLRFDLISRHMFGRSITVIQARWLMRIAPHMDSVDEFVVLVLAREYGAREKAAALQGREIPRTGDLDKLLAVRPWQFDENLVELARDVVTIEFPLVSTADDHGSQFGIWSVEMIDWIRMSLGLDYKRDYPYPNDVNDLNWMMLIQNVDHPSGVGVYVAIEWGGWEPDPAWLESTEWDLEPPAR